MQSNCSTNALPGPCTCPAALFDASSAGALNSSRGADIHTASALPAQATLDPGGVFEPCQAAALKFFTEAQYPSHATWAFQKHFFPQFSGRNSPPHLARHALPNGALHQAAEGRQHIDGRVHLPVVQLPINVDLCRPTGKQIHSPAADAAARSAQREKPQHVRLTAADQGRLHAYQSSSQRAPTSNLPPCPTAPCLASQVRQTN